MRCSPVWSNSSPGFAARQTSSASVSAARPSPSLMRTSIWRASGSSGSALPCSASALASSLPMLSSECDWKVSTRARERSAALSSNEGFSVVAPTSTTVPSSITGRKESCCARLKRWISSTKSSVCRPLARLSRAASNTRFRSATPENTAEICSKARFVSPASKRATVVLPVPGGPQKIIEPSEPERIIRVSAPSSPVRCSWPTTSSRCVGRSRSASGRPGSGGFDEGSSNRSAISSAGLASSAGPRAPR